MSKPLSRARSLERAAEVNRRGDSVQGAHGATRVALCPGSQKGGTEPLAHLPNGANSEPDVHVKVRALSERIGVLCAEMGDCFRELGIVQKELAECAKKSVMGTSPREQPTTPVMRKKLDLLTTKDVAELVRCDAKTIRRWRNEGKLPPAISFGGSLVRWCAADIDAWIEAQMEHGK